MRCLERKVHPNGEECITLIATKKELIRIWAIVLSKLALEKERIEKLPETIKAINQLEDIIFNN